MHGEGSVPGVLVGRAGLTVTCGDAAVSQGPGVPRRAWPSRSLQLGAGCWAGPGFHGLALEKQEWTLRFLTYASGLRTPIILPLPEGGLCIEDFKKHVHSKLNL